jgi:hypothetical protein
MTRFMNSARLGSSDTPSRSRFLATTAGIVAASLIAFVPIASAGKPTTRGAGGGGGTSFTVADGTYGGTTVAAVSNPPAGTWVVATCYQAGSPVIFNRLEVDSAGQAVLTLGPTTGYTAGAGGADCDAEAKYWNLKRQRWISLATTTFHVAD